jgi:integrin alpha FG-GAP repeat containing protein 1
MRHTTPIYNVITGDFTLDGKLDILVMSANSATTLDMALYKGNHDGTFGMYAFTLRVGLCLKGLV